MYAYIQSESELEITRLRDLNAELAEALHVAVRIIRTHIEPELLNEDMEQIFAAMTKARSR